MNAQRQTIGGARCLPTRSACAVWWSVSGHLDTVVDLACEIKPSVHTSQSLPACCGVKVYREQRRYSTTGSVALALE